ncbi:hypothetical protein KCU94_g200, partial [Aureobasidium melanogenum]
MGRKVPGLWVYRRRTQILNVLLILIPNRRSSSGRNSLRTLTFQERFLIRGLTREAIFRSRRRASSG